MPTRTSSTILIFLGSTIVFSSTLSSYLTFAATTPKALEIFLLALQFLANVSMSTLPVGAVREHCLAAGISGGQARYILSSPITVILTESRSGKGRLLHSKGCLGIGLGLAFLLRNASCTSLYGPLGQCWFSQFALHTVIAQPGNKLRLSSNERRISWLIIFKVKLVVFGISVFVLRIINSSHSSRFDLGFDHVQHNIHLLFDVYEWSKRQGLAERCERMLGVWGVRIKQALSPVTRGRKKLVGLNLENGRESISCER